MRVAVIIPTLDPTSEMAKTSRRAAADTPWASDAVDVQSVKTQWDEDKEGFAVTCNKGAKAEAKADLLVFLNDDTIPQPGWLEPLVEAAQRHGIAGAHLIYPDGSTQHSGVFLRRQPELTAYNRKRPAPSGEVPCVTGACLAIRRDLWDQLGGFDEGFVNGYEDVDLCLRAREAGHSVWFCAESVVIHLESQSPPDLRFGHAAENIDLLQQRWGHLPI